ncbi:MAG: rRNA maturation RNase YbeY [Deltaproteobacteria bacterium]|nr:rRNA maturation RNase YbeY [Deltaproteobacteria bacterium]
MCTELNFQGVDVSFLLTTNREISTYHRRFMNDPSVTDVITFADKNSVDVVISLDQAQAQAKPRGISLFHEVALLMCHALLHAKGFDDLTEKEALKMRQAEFETLAKIF